MRLIDADALIKHMESNFDMQDLYLPVHFKDLIDEQPTIDNEGHPKKAHWVKRLGMMPPEFTGHFECDNCGWHGKLGERETDYNFCPGCGAKMSIGFPGFDGDDCKSTPFDEILGDYLKKMDNENEKEK